MSDRKAIADIVITLSNSVVLKGETVKFPELTAKEWNDVLIFASKQGVLPIVTPLFADRAEADAGTRTVMVQWYAAALGNSQRYRLRLKTMRQLAGLLAGEGMDVMFMKGAALAQLYPNPEWRVFSDIDYYLYGKSRQGIEAMAQQGIGNSAYYHHHTQASLNGVLLENHYDFVERVNHRCDIILDDALKALAEKEGKAIPAAFLGDDIKNAYVMTPTMNAIFLMRHMSAHFMGETIPLRQLYDWAIFLREDAKDVDWQLVTKLYEQSGMARFAGIIQQILCSHLDFECEECPIAPGAQEDAERVWDSVIHPPKQDPYKKFSLKYYFFETKTFFSNRWKHKMVYPGESFALLFFKYTWLGIKKMTGRLKTE